jgi:hypothetical protein
MLRHWLWGPMSPLGLGDFRNTIQGIFKVGQALGSG